MGIEAQIKRIRREGRLTCRPVLTDTLSPTARRQLVRDRHWRRIFYANVDRAPSAREIAIENAKPKHRVSIQFKHTGPDDLVSETAGTPIDVHSEAVNTVINANAAPRAADGPPAEPVAEEPEAAVRTIAVVPDPVDKTITRVVVDGVVRGTVTRHTEKRWSASAGGIVGDQQALGEGKTRAAAVELIKAHVG